MEQSREKMKALFGNFVDMLVEDELEAIRLEMIRQKSEILAEFDAFRQTVQEEMSQSVLLLKEELKSLKTHLAESLAAENTDEIVEELSIVRGAVENLATQTAETFSTQEDYIRETELQLREQVEGCTEAIDHMQGNHEQLAMLLNTFAMNTASSAKTSAVSKKRKQPNDETAFVPENHTTENSNVASTTKTIPAVSDIEPSNKISFDDSIFVTENHVEDSIETDPITGQQFLR